MAETKMQLEDWLDDLCVRFIINIPDSELCLVERICFQIEEAQWYYEDFIRPLDPSLPSLNLRNFTQRIFAHCPLLAPFSASHRTAAFDEFMRYKTRIPVRGAIMLNENLDEAILVKGWKKGANWSFPRGKINWAEDDLICAMREVYEETGYDIEAAGLVPEDRQVKYIDMTMHDQQVRLYVFKDVPKNTHFAARTRKEISKIAWWPLADLPSYRKKGQQQQQQNVPATNPNKFYMVAPFLPPLKRWIIEQKKQVAQRSVSNQYLSAGMSHDELLTEEDQGAESQGPSYPSPSRQHIDTLKGTEEALRALLKIQPPTHGVQSSAATAVQSPAAENKGGALLAFLKGDPAPQNQQKPGNPPSQTPLEHTITHPPQPDIPHYQHSRPPHLSALPPTPTFPLHQPPNPFLYQDPPEDSHRHHAVPGHPQPQSHMHHVQQPPRPYGNPHSYQSPHLVHPQPLPPQVQRAVFTGDGIRSPMMPQPTQQYFQPAPNPPAPHGPMNPQFPGLHAPMLPQVNQQPQAQLTRHTLSLLNAFKSQDQANGSDAGRDLILNRFTNAPQHQEAPPQQSRPQELPADVAPPTKARAPPQYEAKPTAPAMGYATFSARKPADEKQKSTLLGLFKSPPTQALAPVRSDQATALPMTSPPPAVELSAVDTLSSHAVKASPGEAYNKPVNKSLTNANVPEMNPEINLPFRAMKILARPTQPQSQAQSSESEAPKSHPIIPKKQSNGKETVLRNKHPKASPEQAFQPQILKRPQSDIPMGGTSSAFPSASALATVPTFTNKNQQPPVSAQLLQSLSRAPPTATPSVPQLDRPSQQSDQQQKLLSLFGAPSPATPVKQTSAVDVLSSLFSIDPTMHPSAKSRVGSLASGEASRRSSQTPMSPADKGFLLSYLDSVTKGSQR